ncbi:MAG: type I-C CRISPR-associated protein Cas8c/Csd1 [Polyangiaceae bacterium]|nr:type I-C CRISPR-associated protein Cas8c/Csd1 [Polyangiaceae bacterium]
MLSALYELAKRKNLVDDPDFEKKKVDFFIRVDLTGRFLGLVPTQSSEGRALEIKVPRFPKRAGSGTVPGFLFDNAKYVLGVGGEDAERNERCVEAFRTEVDKLAQQTGDEGAVAVARFFEKRQEQLAEILAQHPDGAWTGGEWLAFKLDNDEERCVHDRPDVRAYWAVQRQAKPEGENDLPVRCLVTGEVGLAARTHDNIKRVPQAQTSGAALVSFNAAAFVSHGLQQGENAPVSRAAAEGYVTALNSLLEGGAKRRFSQGIAMGDDAVLVFWTREDTPFCDDLLDALDPVADPEAVREMVKSPLKGLEPAPIDTTHFYAVTLSGNAALVVVRDWMEVPVGQVKQNLRRYFGALSLAGSDGQPLGVRRLLSAIETPSGSGLSPNLETKLVRSALYGSPIPREVLSAALRRLRLPPHKLDERRQLHARCALIKAALMDLPDWKGTKEVTVALDENNTETPYLLGRLFAALERLQAEAQGDINATIRDKFFGAASSTPGLIFPRLIRLSMHHAAKIREGKDPFAEITKARIIEKLQGEALPNTLNLADQGLFAIGYYHQRQAFFTPKSEGAKPESDKHESETSSTPEAE